MGNMTTHRESNLFFSTTSMSIESSTKTSNPDSVGSSESSSENGLPQEKISLGTLNPITNETQPGSEVVSEEESSKGKNMVLGQELKINTSSSSHLNESLGGSDANSEVAEDSLPKSPPKDSNAKMNSHLKPSLGSKPSLLPIPAGPSYDIPVSITASEILLSEDYTRVICYGPNPKITHTFYDFSLECHPKHLIISFGKKREIMSVFRQESTHPRGSDSCSSREFLKFCNACNKKLKEGEDIYRYRGESSFCSSECLAVGILAEEITKAAKESSNGPSVFLMDQKPLPPYPKGQ